MEGNGKKGMLQRLAAFWKNAGPEAGGGRLAWRKAGRTKKPGGRPGRTEEGGFPFREKEEESGFLLKRAFAEGQEKARQAGQAFFAAGFPGREKRLFAPGKAPGQAGRQERIPTGRNGVPKGRKAQETRPWAVRQGIAESLPEMAQAFFWDSPENSGQERKPLPPAGSTAKKRGRAGEDTAAAVRMDTAQKQPEEGRIPREKEKRTAERRQDTLPDIDGLMREMTKRLWEEREGCGRRLGG